MKRTTIVLLALLTVLVSLMLPACEGITPTPTVSPLREPGPGYSMTEAETEILTDIGDEVTAALPAWLVELAAAIWAMPAVKFLVGQIGLNTLVAVAVSLYQSKFEWKKLADFLLHKIAPYILVYAGAALLGEASGQTWLATVTLGVLETRLLADLVGNLQTLGIPLPAEAA